MVMAANASRRLQDGTTERFLSKESYTPPHSDLEIYLCDKIAELVGVAPVGLDDDFFMLKGNSLLAVKLIAEVRSEQQADIDLEDFFDEPTARTLVQLISGIASDTEKSTDFDKHPDIEVSREEKGEAVKLDFSVFFFSGDDNGNEQDKYGLVKRAGVFCDENGFKAIWTPERHFHQFGSLYPNPSVLSAALASMTQRIQVRAGAVAAPLHHPIRIAEDWSLIDNLSGGGRIGVAFAQGFHPNDFALYPDRFGKKKQLMMDAITKVRHLWQGKHYRLPSGTDYEFDVKLHPKPLTKELPIWISTGGNPETYREAGAIGANIITALLFMTKEEMKERIQIYHNSLREHGYDPQDFTVTVMLHTYIGASDEEAIAEAKEPFMKYLESHVDLLRPFVKSYNVDLDAKSVNQDDLRALLEFSYKRYSKTSSFIGGEETALRLAQEYAALGINEIACLVDFGIPRDKVMASLERVAKVNQMLEANRKVQARTS